MRTFSQSHTVILYITLSKRILNNWSLWFSFTTRSGQLCSWRAAEKLKISSTSVAFYILSLSRSQFGKEMKEMALWSNQAWLKQCGINEFLSFIFNGNHPSDGILLTFIHSLFCVCCIHTYMQRLPLAHTFKPGMCVYEVKSPKPIPPMTEHGYYFP